LEHREAKAGGAARGGRRGGGGTLAMKKSEAMRGGVKEKG